MERGADVNELGPVARRAFCLLEKSHQVVRHSIHVRPYTIHNYRIAIFSINTIMPYLNPIIIDCVDKQEPFSIPVISAFCPRI